LVIIETGHIDASFKHEDRPEFLYGKGNTVLAQLHSLATLHLGRESPEPTQYETGWTPAPVWVLGKRKTFLAPAED
jgi:hypothetical protein